MTLRLQNGLLTKSTISSTFIDWIYRGTFQGWDYKDDMKFIKYDGYKVRLSLLPWIWFFNCQIVWIKIVLLFEMKQQLEYKILVIVYSLCYCLQSLLLFTVFLIVYSLSYCLQYLLLFTIFVILNKLCCCLQSLLLFTIFVILY